MLYKEVCIEADSACCSLPEDQRNIFSSLKLHSMQTQRTSRYTDMFLYTG